MRLTEVVSDYVILSSQCPQHLIGKAVARIKEDLDLEHLHQISQTSWFKKAPIAELFFAITQTLPKY